MPGIHLPNSLGRVALTGSSSTAAYEFSVFQGGEEPAVEGGVGPRRATRRTSDHDDGGSGGESVVEGRKAPCGNVCGVKEEDEARVARPSPS